ncbi:hypothetical protein CR513_12885, partial [Mucuna pruriens]
MKVKRAIIRVRKVHIVGLKGPIGMRGMRDIRGLEGLGGMRRSLGEVLLRESRDGNVDSYLEWEINVDQNVQLFDYDERIKVRGPKPLRNPSSIWKGLEKDKERARTDKSPKNGNVPSQCQKEDPLHLTLVLLGLLTLQVIDLTMTVVMTRDRYNEN